MIDRHSARLPLSFAAVILAGALSASPVLAQPAGTGGTGSTGTGSSSGGSTGFAETGRTKKLSGQTSTTAAGAAGFHTTDPKAGGVAGTGMGGSTSDGLNGSTALGTGMSVPGPAGSALTTGSMNDGSSAPKP